MTRGGAYRLVRGGRLGAVGVRRQAGPEVDVREKLLADVAAEVLAELLEGEHANLWGVGGGSARNRRTGEVTKCDARRRAGRARTRRRTFLGILMSCTLMVFCSFAAKSSAAWRIAAIRFSTAREIEGGGRGSDWASVAVAARERRNRLDGYRARARRGVHADPSASKSRVAVRQSTHVRPRSPPAPAPSPASARPRRRPRRPRRCLSRRRQRLWDATRRHPRARSPPRQTWPEARPSRELASREASFPKYPLATARDLSVRRRAWRRARQLCTPRGRRGDVFSACS